jgi:membrane-associated phospholipid phosphatase
VGEATPTDSGRANPTYVRRRLDVGALAVAILVAAACAVVAATGVPEWEAWLFHRVNDLPDLLYRPMWLAQFLGLLLLPAAVAVVAAILRRWRLALALVLLVPLKLLVEKGVLKQLVDRQRPGTSVCDQDLSCLHARDVPVVGPSFPSGHAIIAFGIAWLLAPYLSRRWQAVVFAVAALVAFARVYLGAHNPLDVTAGAAAGVAVGSLLNLVVGVPRREVVEPGPGAGPEGS